jgi:hypothetical protein
MLGDRRSWTGGKRQNCQVSERRPTGALTSPRDGRAGGHPTRRQIPTTRQKACAGNGLAAIREDRVSLLRREPVRMHDAKEADGGNLPVGNKLLGARIRRLIDWQIGARVGRRPAEFAASHFAAADAGLARRCRRRGLSTGLSPNVTRKTRPVNKDSKRRPARSRRLPVCTPPREAPSTRPHNPQAPS